jgi:protein TonB
MSVAVSQQVPAPRRKETARWTASLAAVVLVHAGIGWLLLRQLPMQIMDAAPPAVILDLAPPEPAAEAEPAPEPPAPAEPAPAAPAPPEPAPPEPAPPEPPPPEIQQPEPPPPEPPPPEPPPPDPVIEDAVPLPEPPKPIPPPKPQAVKPPPKPRPVVQRAAPVPTEAPPTEATTTAPTATTGPSASRATAAAATTSWQGRLQAHLARFKQYPTEARLRHHEGTPVVRFTMTRSGKVLSYRLENSSGHDLLDQEALALIERAQPLPPLPDEVPNATIELVLPLRFQLR